MVVVVSRNSDACKDLATCSFEEKKSEIISPLLSGDNSEDEEDEKSLARATARRRFFLEDENIRLKLTIQALERELKSARSNGGIEQLHPLTDHTTPWSQPIDHLPNGGANRPRSLSALDGTVERRENMPMEGPLPSVTRTTAAAGSAAASHDIESHQSAPGLHHRRVPGPPKHESEYTPLNVMANYDSTNSSDPDDSEFSMGRAGLDGLAPATATVSAASPLSFCTRVQDRAGWLVGLLVLQSMSSFIISRNEALLQAHLVIVQFLTMLVGAGGNAGNQASVRVIRGLATGQVNDDNVNSFLLEEFKMGLALSGILGLAGCIRALVFAVPWAETLAITTSLLCIVFISILLGALLPLGMKRLHIDPAHSSTTIQVLMDILGVSITVAVSGMVLDPPFHKLRS